MCGVVLAQTPSSDPEASKPQVKVAPRTKPASPELWQQADMGEGILWLLAKGIFVVALGEVELSEAICGVSEQIVGSSRAAELVYYGLGQIHALTKAFLAFTVVVAFLEPGLGQIEHVLFAHFLVLEALLESIDLPVVAVL